MKCHVYFTVLDDLCNGLENRFNQETLNLISAIGHLIELKTKEFDIKLISQSLYLIVTN